MTRLANRTAIVYGGAGLIGATVARRFASEGAAVFLAGRTLEPLNAVAAGIAAAGGSASVAVVDATDEGAVEAHADAVLAEAGRIDVSFNAVNIRGDLQGTPLAELSHEDFATPITLGTTTHFLTARAAGRRMRQQRSGVGAVRGDG